MSTTTVTYLTQAQVQTVQRITHHQNMVLLVMFLALLVFGFVGHIVAKALTK